MVEIVTIFPERRSLGVGVEQRTGLLMKLLKSFIAHFPLRGSCSFPLRQRERVEFNPKIFAK